MIEGDTVRLPCNISANEWNNNEISLVVWYRSMLNNFSPIYSIDTRSTLSKSRHQIMPEWQGRLRLEEFNDGHSEEEEQQQHHHYQHLPPLLHINAIQFTDAGDYRCRVDYRMNRTKHFLIHLNVSGKYMFFIHHFYH